MTHRLHPLIEETTIAPAARTVADSTEAEVIALLVEAADRAVPAPAPDPAAAGAGDLLVANGDDAAVICPRGPVVVSTDMIVEDTHFRRDWSTPHDIGARAVAQAASDIAAMGAHTDHIVLALCLPPQLPLEDVRAIGQGAALAAAQAGARIIGGDVTTGAALVLVPTAMGHLPGAAGGAGGNAGGTGGGDPVRPLTLCGARPGDVLALTGYPGRAAAGLDLIAAGHHSGPAQDAFRVPRPPYALGPAAATSGAHALTDVTDGLLRDAAAMARASGVVVALDTAAFPADPVLEQAAATLADPGAVDRWRLTGGEDHGLLGAFGSQDQLPQGLWKVAVIQSVGEGRPAGTVLVDGQVVEAAGWDSARRATG